MMCGASVAGQGPPAKIENDRRTCAAAVFAICQVRQLRARQICIVEEVLQAKSYLDKSHVVCGARSRVAVMVCKRVARSIATSLHDSVDRISHPGVAENAKACRRMFGQ